MSDEINTVDHHTVKKKTWDEFSDSGLLWWINRILHSFGWSIVIVRDDKKDNKVTGAFPARTKYRGFSKEVEEEGYKRLTKYIRENAEELEREINE